MTALESLSAGLGRTRTNKRVLLLYWLSNLAIAAIVVAPIAAVLATVLDGRLESVRLFRNLDGDWIVETFLRFTSAPFSVLPALGLVIAALYLLFSTFLAGGAIAMLYREDDSFFAACARYFPRFFRILLVSVIFYAVAFAIMRALGGAHEHWAVDSMSDAAVTSTNWLVRLVAFVLFVFVNAIFDYAKIACVVEDRKALASTRRALVFLWRNFGSFAAVLAIVTVIGLAALALYSVISELIGQASMAAVLVLFLVRQIYIAARFWIRLWTWSSEMALYGSRMPAAQIVATVPVSEPVLPPETAAGVAGI